MSTSKTCATCKFWLVPDRVYFEGQCTNPESPFNNEYLHRNDGCQQYVVLENQNHLEPK